MKKYLYILPALVLAFFAFSNSQASEIDYGYIISDEEFLSVHSMTLDQIQAFLDSHVGTLKDYFDLDVDGHFKTTAMIVHDAAQRHGINPQVLLVLLQKEQGLITDTEPYQSQFDWATGYAVCDRCDINHPIVTKYKGFAKQIDSAAWRLTYYIENIDKFNYKPGFSYNIDGLEVNVKNISTAALYNYTPHLNGNKIFSKLWKSWFKSVSTLSYPSGTLLQGYGEAGVWLVKNGVRHAFMSKTALTTRFDINQIIQVPQETINQYPAGDSIAYPQYALLRTNFGQIYLLVDDELRWIEDEETFRQLGFMLDEIEDVEENELAFFTIGDPITMLTLEPFGSLVQDPDSFGIYFVKNGLKRPLIAPELLELNFSHLKVRKASLNELDHYIKEAPVTLKDGLLVKTAESPEVYVISNGKRLVIDSEYTFNALGYNWQNIKTVSSNLLSLHEEGDPLGVEQSISDTDAAELIE